MVYNQKGEEKEEEAEKNILSTIWPKENEIAGKFSKITSSRI